MTNDQLTIAFAALASFLVGYVITQWKHRQSVERRLEAHEEALNLIVKSVEKNHAKHALVMGTVKNQLIAIRDSLQRFRTSTASCSK